MTPQTFIQKWGPGGPAFSLNEEQGAQSHFLDLCELLEVPKPGSEAGYLFEEKSSLIGGRTGYADVFRRGAFAWENKAPGKNLDVALRQLLGYSLALSNPPILVVCDRLTIRIHTQFNGHPTESHSVLLAELDRPDKLALLRRIWLEPESFRPKKTSRDITEKAAKSFATLAAQLRKTGHDPQKVSHFLTQCLFCFFAEDVGLLPDRLFEKMINAKLDLPTRHGLLPSEKLTRGLATLFESMRTGDLFGVHDIARFNGGLFKTIDVPQLDIMNVTELRNAAEQNWSAIDVSIFGTLFERGLDPAKRSQLGAHYTDPATIMRIVEPVLKRPLLQVWEQLTPVLQALLAKSSKKGDKNYKLAQARFIDWLDQLKNYRVLDPACGSGNFLFMGLKALKDIEHRSHLEAAALGLDREADLVTGPHNMLGIELNEYAAELARVTVWIGELQWRLLHGYEFKTNPVLEPLDHIECRDALLDFPAELSTESPNKLPLPLGEGRGEGRPRILEAAWPKADIVIGNPPFLGDKKMRAELGHEYTETLRAVYKGRVPGGADLVCYWFEKARKAIETNGLHAAGLVATNSIRGGKNRAVLDAIARTSRIYEAWSDEGWVNEGAAVHVSLVAFGQAQQTALLDGVQVFSISSSLTPNEEDRSNSLFALTENADCALQGPTKGGSFEVSGSQARNWLLHSPNPNRQSSADVLLPWFNGASITGRSNDDWIVDFSEYTLAESSLYEAPFAHVVAHVKVGKLTQARESRRQRWWLFNETAPKLRLAAASLPRLLVTPEVSKHRLWSWLSTPVCADKNLVIVVRSDDVTFGVLQSRIHSLWALRYGTSLENRPRYTSTTTFRTFPFPEGLTPADTAHQRTERVGESPHPSPLPGGEGARNGAGAGDAAIIPAGLSGDVRTAAEKIAIAAKRLNDLRENWLNPPEWTQRVAEVIPLGMDASPYPDRIVPRHGHEKELAERTLTKLYNQRPAWLDAAHKMLDAAVAAAYGWVDYNAGMPDEEILKRLLALNLERAVKATVG